MDSPDLRSGVSYLVSVLRRITRIVQLIPFAYLLALALYLITESFLPEWIHRTVDATLNAPLYVIAGMLGTGRLLKLCRWFKAACLMPVATKVESFVDSFLFTFTQGEIIAINVSLGILFLIYIYAANKHFFHGRKENTI